MTDTPENTANTDAAQNEQTQPPMVINGQYVKDLSFESPRAPGVFSELSQKQPDIPITVDINVTRLQEKTFEVVLNLKVDAKVDGNPAFLVELAYGGVFTLNVADEHLQPMLMIECPRMMFPFARNIIADTTRDGGFPPLMLQPIDFVSLFRQRLAEQADGDDTQTA